MRIFIPPFLALVFIGWVLYVLLIKKDIKKHKGDIIGGFIFLGVWVVINAWMWLA